MKPACRAFYVWPFVISLDKGMHIVYSTVGSDIVICGYAVQAWICGAPADKSLLFLYVCREKRISVEKTDVHQGNSTHILPTGDALPRREMLFLRRKNKGGVPNGPIINR